MACACTKRKKQQYVWSREGTDPVVYNSEIEAKAKIIREERKTGDGGSYAPLPAGG